MATAVTVTGQGGMQMAGTTQAISAGTGLPPELHITQWGLQRLDIGCLEGGR